MREVNKRAKSQSPKNTGEDIELSHTGASKARTASQREKARTVEVKMPKATHEYKGQTQQERAKDRAKANDIAYCE